MSDKIKIDSVTGASDGNDLKNCYFLDAGDGTYSFYDKNPNNPNNPLATNITASSEFDFSLEDYPGIVWTITVSAITDEAASGDWSDVNTAKPEEAAGDGTFQAQAGGGTGVPGDDAAASVSA